MNYIQPYIEYFRTFRRSDILTLFGIIITIAVFIVGIIFVIWHDIKKKQRDRFNTFKETLLPLIKILENRKLPDMSTSEYTQFFNNMLATQEVALNTIETRLSRKRRDIFNQKWDEYKEKCEPYKNGGIRAYVLFEMQKDNNEVLKLINEILEIAKNN